MLNWADRFNIFCFLDNNGYPGNSSFECLLAVDCKRSFSFPPTDALQKLQLFFDERPSYLFGHMGYNAVGNAYTRKKPSGIDFGPGFLFEPEIILQLKDGALHVLHSDIDASLVLKDVLSTGFAQSLPTRANITAGISREEYVKKINILKEHIQRGDCYEINFCQSFYSDNISIDPIGVYEKLSIASAAPFAALYKLQEKYCICASPERFLKKKGNRLISQPIKGTIKRDHKSKEADEKGRGILLNSPKEKSENVMIVDLVRNDLSRVCERASVKVTELFGVYTFPQVHHLITTVEGILEKDKTFTDAIAACYPMGSMTGAPKKRVMKLIEENEEEARGLFSGSIGYITPEGDFDLNVIIRSIFADTAAKKICFSAGSGITVNSEAEAEYEECLAKAEAIMKILGEEQGV